jgi:hypothetical protein
VLLYVYPRDKTDHKFVNTSKISSLKAVMFLHRFSFSALIVIIVMRITFQILNEHRTQCAEATMNALSGLKRIGGLTLCRRPCFASQQ